VRGGQALGTTATEVARSGGRPPYRLFIQPLRAGASDALGFRWGFEAGLLLLVDDPDRASSAARVEALVALFGLTRAEARVADRLGRGESIATIAAAHGVSVATILSQLKHIRAKTGTSRQGNLVAVINRLPA
jgi:DNA-binding CsgD family transcriptional regulator